MCPRPAGIVLGSITDPVPQGPHQPDAVLVALRMPDVDGRQILDHLAADPDLHSIPRDATELCDLLLGALAKNRRDDIALPAAHLRRPAPPPPIRPPARTGRPHRTPTAWPGAVRRTHAAP